MWALLWSCFAELSKMCWQDDTKKSLDLNLMRSGNDALQLKRYTDVKGPTRFFVKLTFPKFKLFFDIRIFTIWILLPNSNRFGALVHWYAVCITLISNIENWLFYSNVIQSDPRRNVRSVRSYSQICRTSSRSATYSCT